MGDDYLKEIDPSKDKVPKAAKYYMQIINQQNIERARRNVATRYKNRVLALVLATTVGSIYTYTMYATKQETFLDDFDEPLMISDENPPKN